MRRDPESIGTINALLRIGVLTGIFSQYVEYRSSIRWLLFREQPKLVVRVARLEAAFAGG